jgi:RNA polymerase sigma-70 factor (ECF subfamily)
MLASLEGDAALDRALLGQLSRRLRAYYKGKLAGIGKNAIEAEDLVQEAVWPSTSSEAARRFPTYPVDEADTIMAHDDNFDAESTHDVTRLIERLPKNMRSSVEALKLDGRA